jgi:hypothetical protein
VHFCTRFSYLQNGFSGVYHYLFFSYGGSLCLCKDPKKSRYGLALFLHTKRSSSKVNVRRRHLLSQKTFRLTKHSNPNPNPSNVALVVHETTPSSGCTGPGFAQSLNSKRRATSATAGRCIPAARHSFFLRAPRCCTAVFPFSLHTTRPHSPPLNSRRHRHHPRRKRQRPLPLATLPRSLPHHQHSRNNVTTTANRGQQ